MSLKVYHVEGVRHFAVIFAFSPEEAVAQAIERGLVGSWEAPSADEAPLPPGYRLVYDPQTAAGQPEPDRPHTITRSGGSAPKKATL